MNQIKKLYHEFKFVIGRFDDDEAGSSAVEYGILVAGIAAVVVVTINTIGTKVLAAFTALDTALGP
jgi:pilus assembly protein Flp/PilA